MMLAKDTLFKQGLFKNYSKQSLWNLSIIGLYIILIYLPDITRYKNIVMGLIGATALWYIVRDFRAICRIFKNNLALSLLLLLIAIGWSILISVDPAISLKEINKPILNGLLLFAITFPIVLYKEKPVDIAKMVMIAFAIGLLVIMTKELVQYYLEYREGILPFTRESQKAHREISYSLVFFAPLLIAFCIINIARTSLLAFQVPSSILFFFLILGTMSRSAWLALFLIVTLMLLIHKNLKLIIINLNIVFLFFIIATQLPKNTFITEKLQNKLLQFDSGSRLGNGTQGSALELILNKPVRGYGYGNQLYHNVYNERVKDYPNWKFQKSVGPHNVFLAFWFAGGILGLFSILYFCASIIAQGIQLIRKNTGIIRQASLVLLMSFLGVYVFRGLFENAYINQVGILVGLMLALRYSLLNHQKTKLPEGN